MDYTAQLNTIISNQAIMISWVQMVFVGLCLLLGVIVAGIILGSHK
jgi:VIT1/CCC1 family predicted Fe2+/Mn2+ transporter